MFDFFFRFGPRFFGLSNAYDKKWRKIAKNVALSLNLQDRVKEGTLFDFGYFALYTYPFKKKYKNFDIALFSDFSPAPVVDRTEYTKYRSFSSVF